MRGRSRAQVPVGMAVTGTLVVHGLVGVFLFATPAGRVRLPPTYTVRLLLVGVGVVTTTGEHITPPSGSAFRQKPGRRFCQFTAPDCGFRCAARP